MVTIKRWILSFYNFLVGDMRILVGTLLALGITWLMVGVAPALAGWLFILMVIATLTVALWREVTP
jgi:hypothetical protein